MTTRPAARIRSATARRTPRQARAQATVAAILQAARELIATRGYAATTTNHIAARAGISIGSLYQYFPGKTAILEAIAHEHVEEVHRVVGAFLERASDPRRPFASLLRELFLDLVELHATNPRLHRVLAEEAPHLRRSRGKRRKDPRAESLAVARLLETRPDLHVRHPLEAAHVLEQATEALTYWLVHEAPASLDRDAYVEEAVALLAGYLTGSRSRPRGGAAPD